MGRNNCGPYDSSIPALACRNERKQQLLLLLLLLCRDSNWVPPEYKSHCGIITGTTLVITQKK
jgi:hypothetical protein